MKEEFQSMYNEYMGLVQQFQQLQQNINSLDKHINDLNELNNNIDNITETKINSETLIPMGNGIFLFGEIKDNKKALMNVGANVCVEKDLIEVKTNIEKQVNETGSLLMQMQEYARESVNRINELQEHLKEHKE